VRIRDYLSKPKGVCGQKSWQNTALDIHKNLQDNEDSSPLAGYAMSIYKYKCKIMVTSKASQMKTLKKISSFIADKFDTALLFFNMVPTVLRACPSALHQHLDY